MISWINSNLGTYENWVFEIIPNGSSLFWVASKRENGKLMPIEGDRGSDHIEGLKYDLQNWLVNRLREEKEIGNNS